MRTQEILARLYTEAGLRERFFADPRSVAKELRLTEAELQLLMRLPAAQVDFFARSLTHKRAREVSKLLPVTAQVLGKSFDAIFFRFAETYQPCGIKKHFDDALTFARFLRQRVRERALTPPWIGDLACYEAASLEATHSTRRFVWRFFRYAVAPLVTLATIRYSVPSVLPQPCIAIWFRPGRRSRLRHLTLPLPARSDELVILRLNDQPVGEGQEFQLEFAVGAENPVAAAEGAVDSSVLRVCAEG
jgi:hypothetical protein